MHSPSRPSPDEMPAPVAFAAASNIDPEAFERQLGRAVDPTGYPYAVAVESGIPVYDGASLRQLLLEEGQRGGLKSELVSVLGPGPGALLIRAAFADPDVIDRNTKVFERLIATEAEAEDSRGDHFATPGSNVRIWNVLEKLCRGDVAAFVDYYANPLIALCASAWLGPGYQVTAQVNVVSPGGQEQHPHRDYHLGFQSDEVGAQFPLHAHRLCQFLTLRAAVAHCDMPLESGPTLLLPHSHHYELGYLAWRDPRFRDLFQRRCVQLALRKGDLLVLNPALFHAAGSNLTGDVQRIANLLQVSSAFGRPMESVNRLQMTKRVFAELTRRGRNSELKADEIRHVIAASAEGYSFPTNLDRDSPVDGMAPETPQQLTLRALADGWSEVRFNRALEALYQRRRP